MMRIDDLVAAISALQRSDLEAWIREELVVPRQEAGTLLFTDMECARVRLICTLHYELEIDADTLPVVLSLVDQLYDTRQRLLSLTAAVAAQDKDVQAAIIAAMEPNAGSSAADKSEEPRRSSAYNLPGRRDGTCRRFEDGPAADPQEWQRRSGQGGHRNCRDSPSLARCSAKSPRC